MSEEPKNRSRRWIGWALLATLVLYPLSIGPVAWVRMQTDPGTPPRTVIDCVSVIYYPLFFLADHFDPVGRVMADYERWWMMR